MMALVLDLHNLLYVVIAAIILIVAVPVLFVAIECLAALLPHPTAMATARGKVAVLVPAHNEAIVISATLKSLQTQLREDDRIVVVADNCTDATAEVAREHGASVIERMDTQRHGKGWALDYGCRALADDPPGVVVIVDADCIISSGLLDQLAAAALASNGPVQAAYEMPPPPEPRVLDTLSSFSILIKNVVRPRGLSSLGLPCLLNGSGMAMPWRLIKDAPLAGGHVGEEYQLSIDLAIQGFNTRFLPGVSVHGPLPGRSDVARKQRTRWGHTQLQTMRRHLPRLLHEALRQRRLDLLGLACEVGVPPLSLLMLATIATWMAALMVGVVIDQWAPAVASGSLVGILVSSLWLSWFQFGRSSIPWRTLLGIPWYFACHLPLYLVYFIRPQTQWTKTRRG